MQRSVLSVYNIWFSQVVCRPDQILLCVEVFQIRINVYLIYITYIDYINYLGLKYNLSFNSLIYCIIGT